MRLLALIAKVLSLFEFLLPKPSGFEIAILQTVSKSLKGRLKDFFDSELQSVKRVRRIEMPEDEGYEISIFCEPTKNSIDYRNQIMGIEEEFKIATVSIMSCGTPIRAEVWIVNRCLFSIECRPCPNTVFAKNAIFEITGVKVKHA